MMRKILSILFILTLVSSYAMAEVKEEEIAYEADGVSLKGFLAYDDKIEGKRPGVIVVHEWWGHNEYVRKRARMLAELGYTALAVDMYGDGKTAGHPDQAGEFAKAVNSVQGLSQKRFSAGLEVLRNHPTVDADQIAAIGYCFGGATVLNMARQGLDLDAVVSFHGSLQTQTPAQEELVKARVLVCHGADDSFIPQEDVDNFKKEMEGAKVNYKFVSYPGAVHSFTNPDADKFSKEFGMPIAYHPEADAQSWQDMLDLFDDVFAGKVNDK